jgi:hypothetical protein
MEPIPHADDIVPTKFAKRCERFQTSIFVLLMCFVDISSYSDPLRGDALFEQIIASLAPKGELTTNER